MISHFFIDRPVFACVISIIIVFAGLTALRVLPIEQYPNMVPPQIQVTASYPGADAKTVADLIAAPLEQQINGVEDMIYMYSQNSSSGSMALSVFFEIGSNADMALVNTQNRVTLATPLLPDQVQRTGVTVQKQTPNILLIVAIQSTQDLYDEVFVSNYSTINILNDLALVEGVSSVTNINARDYAMRIWLRPDRLAELELTASDIVQAVRDQNTQYAIGQIGQAPNPHPVVMNLPVTALGRLKNPEDFEDIILRAYNDGSYLQIKDVGRVDLGALNYLVAGKLNNKTTTLLAVYQEFGANALDVSDRVHATMKKLSERFPKGLEYSIPYDTTDFIKISIREVSKTIYEAAILVVLVVLLFLQKIRATLIPVLAMIVSIIGTFAGMYMAGFSLNTLTLFGLVLAVGTVVDDAIVVIENVERNMREHDLSPVDAAKKAMTEVTGPVIAIMFVLCAVFIPVAFLGGIAGKLYQQFAITISISVIFSGIVALTLSPAVAALILKKQHKENRFTVFFNKQFDNMTRGYMKITKWITTHVIAGLIMYGLVLLSIFYLFHILPTSFVPEEDQGYLMAVAFMPDGSSLDRTVAVDEQITSISLAEEGVNFVVTFSGFSLLESLNRTTIGSNFIVLNDWSKRTAPGLAAESILKKLQAKFYVGIQDAMVMVFNPPAIQGLGTVGGFEFWIENRGDGEISTLETVVTDFIAAANKRPELRGLNTSLQTDNMMLYVDLDRLKTRMLGVDINQVYESLQVLLGSVFINNFNKLGRTFQVVAQAEPLYRETISDITSIYVRNLQGQMIPLSSIVQVKYIKGPVLVSRFNGYTAAKIIGGPADGYTSGQAMQALVEVANEVLPLDMTYAWSGEAYQERATGGTSATVMFAGMFMVFLILSALYERWSLPLAIILAVPLGIIGALLATWLRGLSNDVYFQVGLVTLIALTAKNAILIVEFAVLKQEEGLSLVEAALEATRQRFRAILMTSLTFIFGVLPLVISKGAGAASRHSVGTGVMGGMITATLLVVLFVPLFYRLVLWKSEKNKTPKEDPAPIAVSEG